MNDTLLNEIPERRRNDAGVSLVEYALLVALIALVCMVGMTQLGAAVGEDFKQVNHQGFAATGGICTPANPDYPDC